jgi:hypothetical protein
VEVLHFPEVSFLPAVLLSLGYILYFHFTHLNAVMELSLPNCILNINKAYIYFFLFAGGLHFTPLWVHASHMVPRNSVINVSQPQTYLLYGTRVRWGSVNHISSWPAMLAVAIEVTEGDTEAGGRLREFSFLFFFFFF